MHELRRLLLEAHREGHSPQVIEGVGASSALGAVVDRPPRQVLVVASPRTALQTPAVAALVHSGAHHYRQTPPNPTVDDALALSHAIDSLRPSAILAVGGGSALDLAKAGRLLKPDPSLLDSGLAGHPRSLRAEPPRLIAVPTTAGTGAEITPFATLYRGRSKVSLDTPACRPDLAVLDGLLTLTCPDGPSLAAALDAMCHSIESGWSLRGTPSSRVYADSARDHLLASLARCEPPSAASPRWASGRSPATASWRHLMLLAAAVAGVAISQTRTTGAHAFSYHLTTEYGVPHGFACAASMSWIASHVAASRPAALGPTTRAAVEMLRLHLDGAQKAELVRLPDLGGAALDDYVDAGLGVKSRTATHPVPLVRASALRHIARDGRLGGKPLAIAARGIPRNP